MQGRHWVLAVARGYLSGVVMSDPRYPYGEGNKGGHTGTGAPFGGSGTTLIACAQTGRKARLIEIDPRYCDVIRRRWTRWAKEAGVNPGSGGLE